MNNQYKPVSCNSYDQFEYAAMRKQMLEIIYHEGDEELTTCEKALNLKTENKQEFLITESKKIRLDRIVSIREI